MKKLLLSSVAALSLVGATLPAALAQTSGTGAGSTPTHDVPAAEIVTQADGSVKIVIGGVETVVPADQVETTTEEIVTSKGESVLNEEPAVTSKGEGVTATTVNALEGVTNVTTVDGAVVAVPDTAPTTPEKQAAIVEGNKVIVFEDHNGVTLKVTYDLTTDLVTAVEATNLTTEKLKTITFNEEGKAFDIVTLADGTKLALTYYLDGRVDAKVATNLTNPELPAGSVVVDGLVYTSLPDGTIIAKPAENLTHELPELTLAETTSAKPATAKPAAAPAKKATLPNTGETTTLATLALAILSVVAGAFAIAPKFKKN